MEGKGHCHHGSHCRTDDPRGHRGRSSGKQTAGIAWRQNLPWETCARVLTLTLTPDFLPRRRLSAHSFELCSLRWWGFRIVAVGEVMCGKKIKGFVLKHAFSTLTAFFNDPVLHSSQACNPTPAPIINTTDPPWEPYSCYSAMRTLLTGLNCHSQAQQ